MKSLPLTWSSTYLSQTLTGWNNIPTNNLFTYSDINGAQLASSGGNKLSFSVWFMPQFTNIT